MTALIVFEFDHLMIRVYSVKTVVAVFIRIVPKELKSTETVFRIPTRHGKPLKMTIHKSLTRKIWKNPGMV